MATIGAFWGFFFILGLVVVESTACGFNHLCSRPATPAAEVPRHRFRRPQRGQQTGAY